MNLTLREIFRYLEANPSSRCIVEGECIVNASHIITCGKVNEACEELKIYAACLQSSGVSNVPHEINGKFNTTDEFVKVNVMTCTCKAGKGSRCKHIAAVLIYCTRVQLDQLEKLSSTDIKCLWSQRKNAVGQKYKPVPILDNDCFKGKNASVRSTKIPENFERNFNLLKEYAPSNSAFLLYMDSDNIDRKSDKCYLSTLLIDNLFENLKHSEVQDFLYHTDMPSLFSCCVNTYNNYIVPESTEVLKDILFKTIENEQLWQQQRQFRITGSRCYGLYTYNGVDWSNKASKYFWPKKFSNKYVEHGIVEESNAREMYEQLFNVKVYKPGLLVSPMHPWLAYSADGIIFKENEPEKLIEIKCPFLGKQHTVSDVLKECKYLQQIDNSFFLKQKHSYYGQIQLGMSLFNVKSCDFIIYSSFDKSVYVINIQHDLEFSKNMLYTLKNIYFSKMLHNICENKDYIK